MSLWCFGAGTCDRVLGALSSWHSCGGLWEWKAERRAPSWAWWAAQPTGKETQLFLQISGHHKVLLAFSVEISPFVICAGKYVTDIKYGVEK